MLLTIEWAIFFKTSVSVEAVEISHMQKIVKGKRGVFSEYLDSGSNNLNECCHKLKDESEKQQLFEVNTDNKEKVYF